MKSIFRYLLILCLSAFALAGCKKTELTEPVTVSLNRELISSLEAGAELRLVAEVRPEGEDVSLVWESSDEKVAVVNDEGVVTGVAAGEATITVKAGEASDECKVVVVSKKPEKIELVPNEMEMTVGTSRTLEVVYTPSNATADDLVWASSDKSVVSADQKGNIMALKQGEAVISAKCQKGLVAAACKVTVVLEDTFIRATEIHLNKSSVELNVGEMTSLSVSFTPADAEVDDLQWSSSDAEVVTVDNGKLLAIKPGKSVITASCYGGVLKASCEVTVNEPVDVPDDLISVVLVAEGNATDIQVGKTVRLTPIYSPSDATPKNVVWTVDKSSLATVDENGVVTGVSANKLDTDWESVTITVVADSKTAYLSLRVIPRQPEDIVVDLPAEGYIKVGQEWYFNPRVIPEGLGYTVYCSSTLPGGKVQNDIYGKYVSAEAGTITVLMAVSDTDNLVYKSFRKEVNLPVQPYWVKSVSLPAEQQMEVGSTMSLVPVFTSDVEGVQPTYKDVKWTSSNPSVASVNEKTGEITSHTAGVADITVTTTSGWAVPSGEPHKSATCKLTVTQANVELNVGDYYYSDGTWSSELNPSKKVIGVVFAKVNATTSDELLAKDYPGCTHGLVLSTVEYASQDFGYVSTYSGHGNYKNLGYDPTAVVNTDKPNGYGNTLAHTAMNGTKPDHCTFFNAADGVVATHSAAVAVPKSASPWYIPSYKEMTMIIENSEVINAALAAAGGQEMAEPYLREESFDDNRTSDWYWTSTIYGKGYSDGTYDHFKYAFDLSRNGWTSSQLAGSILCKVRVVLAF